MQLDSESNIKDDLGGVMSVKFTPGNHFNEYCAKHIDNYDPLQFEILAVRVFYGKETIVTVYAIDRARLKGTTHSPGKMPVKKFKLKAPFLKDIIPFIEECNFTLTTGLVPLERMEVENR
jgi:hypothetical protein